MDTSYIHDNSNLQGTEKMNNLAEWLHNRKDQWDNKAFWALNVKMIVNQVKEYEAEIEKLQRALEIYQRERDRFAHSKPEITGAYFLTGGHGEADDNQLPEFVQICPAYGCGWEQVYAKTDKTISYEGS